MRDGFRAARGCCTLRSLTRGTARTEWPWTFAVCTGHHLPSPLLDRQTVTDISWTLALRSIYPATRNTRRPNTYSEFVVRWGRRSDVLCPHLPRLPPAQPESPLSLNIPRPPTLNFPNLKSISVWKSTINFTLILVEHAANENYF